jgi:hypothetical protein
MDLLMNLDALSSSQHLAETLVLPHKTPTALEPFLKHAVEQNTLLCSPFKTRELGQRFTEFSKEMDCLVIAVPHAEGLDWAAQSTDWVVPYCEVNHTELTTRALVMLGDGPVAVTTFALASILFGVEKVFVAFVTPQGTLAVSYRWNEAFLATIETADTAAERYEFDEYRSARAISLGKPVSGCNDVPALVPSLVRLEADGTFQPYEEPNVQLLPFNPYNHGHVV